MKTTDAGRTWLRKESYECDFAGILFDKHGTGWAYGSHGAIVRSTDGGEHWTLFRLADMDSVNGLFLLGNGTAVAVGSAGRVVKFRTEQPTPSKAPSPGKRKGRR